MKRPTTLAGRAGVAAYALLLALMPRSYREAYGPPSLGDLADLLDEAARFRGQTVVGTALRACLDLIVRLPGEWWATMRFAHVGGRDSLHASPGMGERTMNAWKALRVAARTLAKKPGFTLVAVLTLALGIGANVAIFSIVNAVLLQPLDYEASDRIVEYRHHAPGLDLQELRNSEGMLAFYAEHLDVFEVTAAFGGGSANLTGGEEPVRVSTLWAAPEIFDVLRVQPMIGRPFTTDDAREGRPTVVLLTWDTWNARFGSDPSIVGRTIELDGDAIEVIGVMPEGFAFPDDEADVIGPLYVDPLGQFGEFGLRAVSRLADGVSLETAQSRMTESLTLLPEFFPDLRSGFIESAAFSVSLTTLRDRMVVDIESTLLIILGTVAFVLLIACANVANLFLVRAESRQKEMAVRGAMGGGRSSVAAGFLSESLLLGVGGGIVGVLLAVAGVNWLLAISDVPRAAEVSVGPMSLLLAALLSVVAGLVFGLIPLARYSGGRFAAILRDGGRGSTGGRERHRARNLLVASQLALGLVLLVGSGLMLRSFAQLRSVDLGIEPAGVLTLGLNRNSGEDAEVSARFYQEVADRVASLPGVTTVGVTTNVPLASGNANGGSFYIDGQPRDEDELPPIALHRAVGPGYFSSMGIELLRGREVERADGEEARRVVWVNERFERTHLGGDAIGQRISWNGGDEGEEQGPEVPWAEVVGVVADVQEYGLDGEGVRPSAYFPLRVIGTADVETGTGFLTIKAADGVDPTGLVGGVQAAIREVDPSVPITATRTMTDIVDDAMEDTSITMVILGVATAMALFLGAIGLAGVISYVVGQRTREIGVRVALGASASDVSGMIFRQSMVVIAGGALLGMIGAFGLTRLMEALLFNVSTTDPVTFVTAPLVLVGVSLLATWLPVRKATRVSPTEALRAE